MVRTPGLRIPEPIFNASRRRWIAMAGLLAAGMASRPARVSAAESSDEEPEVPAVEDLMREHGVLRRALLVYAEAASRLSRNEPAHADALNRAADLFRRFGEDYHERSLEEKHVFPPLLKAGGTNAVLVKTLTAQHDRGREITQYITAVTRTGLISAADIKPLSRVLSSFVRMYEHHAAIEDTVIFPAWKKAIPQSQYEDLSGQFEDLERKLFGEDGFEDAVKRIASIEQVFGLADLSALTPPPPPKPA